MAVHDITFASSNGRDTVHGWVFTPVADTIKGLVLLAHGFGEHSRRYLPLVNELLAHGYAVAMDDHVGHGTTAAANDSWGLSGSLTGDVFVEDEDRLRELAQGLVPGVPLLLFGHSWGSMIMRGYLAEHGAGVSGAVLCGTTGMLEGIDEALAAAQAQAEQQGVDAPSDAIGLVLGPFLRRYPEGTSPLAWISDVPAVLADYVADPYNLGERPVSAGFAAAFCELYQRIDAPGWAGQVPAQTPVLLIAGDQDPVGSYGSGVYQVANRLQDAGRPDVRTKLWGGVRHEVHNQPEVRNEVFASVVAFYDEAVAAKRA